MTLTSLKTLAEIVAAPDVSASRASIQLGAYREVFRPMPVGRYFLDTDRRWRVAIALLQIALALPAGYALAKLRFVGQERRVRRSSLACLLVPAQVTFVPVFPARPGRPREHVRRARPALRA